MKNLSDMSNKNSMHAVAQYTTGSNGSQILPRITSRSAAPSNPLYYGQKLNGVESFQYDQNRTYQANNLNRFAQITSAGYQNSQNFRNSGMAMGY